MEDLHKELRFAAICTVILDVLLWLGALALHVRGLAFPLGLLLGSAGMLVNLLLLRRTIQNAVYHGKKRDLAGYLLRVAIASAVMAAGLLFEQISVAGAVFPFLYPKLIFGILSFSGKKPGKKGGTD
ncbi:MAG: hypothetical protein K5695_04900 [Oscillospiraceae bacterium]|nr:hypothetical protein [Oscillospiraceae bacterium]